MLIARVATLGLLGACVTASPVAGQQPAAPPSSGVASGTLPSDADILAIIKQRVDEKQSAGIVVGVIDGNGRQRIVAYGDPGPGQPALDGNSVFEIGSISKVFTSTVLAELVQAGKVSLDDPAQKYLPSTVHVPVRNGKVITLGTLAMQNSGLPRLPTNLKPSDAANPYADYTVQQLYDFLSNYELPRDPGAEFEYSNLGVGLLGHLLSRATGLSYEDLERQRVWQPLNMTNTAITLTPWMKAHLALGHSPRGDVVPNWDIPTLAGAGAIRSTTTDMLKFLDATLHPERGPLGGAMAFAQRERAPAGANMSIGLNWLIMHPGESTIIWHNGGTGGYRTFIGFDPSKKTGVVVMTNTGGAGADDIGFHILNPILPLAPKPAPPKQRTAVDVRPEILSRYVGQYQLAPQFILDITLKDNALYLQATGQPSVRLWPESETEFFIKEVDAQVTFIRDAKGNATAAVLHQGGQNLTAARMPAAVQ
jgi:CubicO group peptidase (beta-lactamase class C family)